MKKKLVDRECCLYSKREVLRLTLSGCKISNESTRKLARLLPAVQEVLQFAVAPLYAIRYVLCLSALNIREAWILCLQITTRPIGSWFFNEEVSFQDCPNMRKDAFDRFLYR